MGLGRLFESRSTLSPAQLWLRDEDMPWSTMSGVTMSQASAMSLTAIYDAVRTISDPVATFPIGQFIRSNGERKPFYPRAPWVDQPDPDPSVGRSDH